MKSFEKINCLLPLLLFVALSSAAQDVIHRKNGRIVEARIIEIGTGEIKYRPFGQPDGTIYVVEKEDILKIVFQDGHTEFYGTARMDDVQIYAGQKRSALKISFLGPLISYTDFIYERNVRPGRSWEARATILGLGKQQSDRPRGFIGSGAFKFYKKPTFYTDNMKRSHLMQGAYVKPEFFLGYSSHQPFDFDEFGPVERRSGIMAGILLNLGKEWVFDDAFVLDIGGGIGYGTGTSVRSIYMNAHQDLGFAGTFNLNVGWMLK